MNIRGLCEFLELDINNINTYSKDDIKKHFKKIALECHPDKLMNIIDINIKNNKIERFKNASIAYNQLIKELDIYGKLSFKEYDNYDKEYDYNNFASDFETFKDITPEFWCDAFDTLMKNKNKTKIFTDTFKDVASFFINNGLKTKEFYKPSLNIIKHNITLPISYYDLYTTKKKKIRLELKNIEEPIFLNIVCSKEYPILIKQFIDDNGEEHEIILKMIIQNKKNSNITYNIRDNMIDLVSDIQINLLDYLIGCKKDIFYINNESLNIDIPPFTSDKIILNNRGLCGGDFIIYLKLNYITKDEWEIVKESDRRVLINAFARIYNTKC